MTSCIVRPSTISVVPEADACVGTHVSITSASASASWCSSRQTRLDAFITVVTVCISIPDDQGATDQ